MIFDVKLDAGFTRKARLVADGHLIDAPASMTYASVVSRDTVRIALTLAALNDCEVLCADVQNAYLNAPPKEKVWIQAGPEFGVHEGKTVVIVRALYGLKGAGAAWATAVRQMMQDMGFRSCLADRDLWMRLACDTTRVPSPDDPTSKLIIERHAKELALPEGTIIHRDEEGGEVIPKGEWYYEYVLFHTDDCMVISRRASDIMKGIDSVYKLKKDKKTGKSWDEPSIYLGAKVGKYRDPEDPDGKYCWTLSGDDYVRNIVNQVQAKLQQQGRQLNAKQISPLTKGYRPELDVTAELDDEGYQWYNELIGELRWAIELGRIDIATEVSLMSSHLALPRRGHLNEALNIYAYLKYKIQSKLVMNPEKMHLRDRYADRFQKDPDWYEFYGDVKEEIPPNAPMPAGKTVETTAWMDADHAGDRLTRRSHSGVLVFLCSAPIIWYSKKQATIESSTFGSEMVCHRTGLGIVKDLRYKLRMMGVPIDGPTTVFGDNKTAVNGISIPEAKLAKKHLGICYHATREASAAGIWEVGFTQGKHNIANCLTKILSGTMKDKECDKFMYRS